MTQNILNIKAEREPYERKEMDDGRAF